MRRARWIALLAALALLLVAAAGWRALQDDHRRGPPPSYAAPHRPAPPLPPLPLDGDVAATIDGATFAVLPAHRAVREIARRFDGRLIGLALVAPAPPEADRGVQLVYAARLLTDRRDVLDIRLDARDGRLLSARGNNLAAARRHGKDD